MMKRYSIFSVLGLALAVSVSVAASGRSGDWTGLWEITQQTDSGPVTLRLFVPGAGEPHLYGSSWEDLVLSQTSFDSDQLTFNWQTQGVNLVFRGKRQGDRVEGTWELIHPQYTKTSPFSAKRLIQESQWEPLRGFDDSAVGLFLDLDATLRSHRSELRRYWEQTFFPQYLPLIQRSPSIESLGATLDDASVAAESRRFAGIVDELAKRLRSKYGEAFPHRFVAVPFGDANPRLVFVGRRSFLVANAAAMVKASPKDADVTVPLELLRTAFDRLFFTAQFPAMESYRTGLPLFLFSQLYPERGSQALGVSAERLQALEHEFEGVKKRASAGGKLNREERDLLAQRFVQYLAESQSPQDLLRLPPSTVNRFYKKFLSESGGESAE